MLQKKHRLERNSFGVVLQSKRRFSHPLLSLTLLSEAEDFRAGFVVSKAVQKSAQKRNTLRRRGYEALVALQVAKEVPRGHLAFFFKKAGGNASFQQIVEAIQSLIADVRRG